MHMETNDRESLNCVVVGNSPEFDMDGEYIDQHDIVMRTGVPVFSNDTGYKTDILVTRERRIYETPDSIINVFDKCVKLEENTEKPDRDKIIILYNNINIPDMSNLLNDIDILYRFNTAEKPTLGIVACSIGLLLTSTISIIGIVTKPTSSYISHGHYNDPNHVRLNNNHNLYKEILTLNKLLRAGTIEICERYNK